MIISDNAQPESNPKPPLFLITVTWVAHIKENQLLFLKPYYLEVSTTISYPLRRGKRSF